MAERSMWVRINDPMSLYHNRFGQIARTYGNMFLIRFGPDGAFGYFAHDQFVITDTYHAVDKRILRRALRGDDRPAANGDAFETEMLHQLVRQEKREGAGVNVA